MRQKRPRGQRSRKSTCENPKNGLMGGIALDRKKGKRAKAPKTGPTAPGPDPAVPRHTGAHREAKRIRVTGFGGARR
jgi:hypothetical protein